jgi:hypothetical protein
VPIYVPGVTLGISRKRKEELGKIVDSRPDLGVVPTTR